MVDKAAADQKNREIEKVKEQLGSTEAKLKDV